MASLDSLFWKFRQRRNIHSNLITPLVTLLLIALLVGFVFTGNVWLGFIALTIVLLENM